MIQPIKCVCHTKPKIRKAQGHAGHVGWYVECYCGRRTEDSYECKDDAVIRWNDMIAMEKGTK